MVKAAPLLVHPLPAAEEYVMACPELAAAATVNLLPYTALEGPGVVTVIVWDAFAAVTVSVTCAALLSPALPACLKMTEQVVVGLVIVTVPLTVVPLGIEQPPDTVIATCSPELAAAATVNLLPYTALEGAGVVTVIVWDAFAAMTVSVICAAAM
jgi:hypothetical protein